MKKIKKNSDKLEDPKGMLKVSYGHESLWIIKQRETSL